jgi:inosine/xanthosine triphosphatase
MLRILVGTANRVKVDAVKEAFSKTYQEEIVVKGLSIKSGVPAQPKGEEVFKGAYNRAFECSKVKGYDFYVGIEGGTARHFGKIFTFAVVCIINSKGKTSMATSGHFPLPKELIELLEKGMELGDAIDLITGRKGAKYEEGAVGILTKGVITRKDLYVHAVILALAPFLSQQFKWHTF